MKEILSVDKPDSPLPLVFDSPHSGENYPEDFDYACELLDLKRTEDRFVNDLFESAPAHGATLLQAHFPRCYIDVNRAIDDIDPKLLDEPWPFGNINTTQRSEAGIGLIRRLIRPGMPIYNRFLSAEEIAHRIEQYYRPYHDMIEEAIATAHYNFGKVWHINCHSMPSAGAFPRRLTAVDEVHPPNSNFVLGNRDGTTCDVGFTRTVRTFLKDLGYSVAVNDPYKGVELVERYSAPTRGIQCLQLEINRALYMNEETLEKNDNYDSLKRDMEKFILFCTEYVQSQLTDLAAD